VNGTAPRILIADDEENIVTSLEFLLRHAGFEVLTAADGEQALQMARAERPDLVLLDVMMPRRNGYEVCQELRSLPQFAALKIVMLTARGREAEAAKGLAMGADAYITKPFSTRELVTRIKSLLGIAA